MASGYVGVTVHRGPKVIMSLRTVKIFWTTTFYDLLEELVNTHAELSSEVDNLSPEQVSRVAICKDQSFINCQVTELNHELAVCLEFSSKYVLYNLVITASPQGSSSNAFTVLMSNAREKRLPPKIQKEALNGPEQLNNDLIDYAGELNVGWSTQLVDSVDKQFIKKLQSALWYIDPHHERLASRGAKLPDRLQKFTGYNDWKRKKKAEPRPQAETLKSHIGALSEVLLEPWINRSEHKEFHSDMEKLMKCLLKYQQHLKQNAHASGERHRSVTPSGGFKGGPEGAWAHPVIGPLLVTC